MKLKTTKKTKPGVIKFKSKKIYRLYLRFTLITIGGLIIIVSLLIAFESFQNIKNYINNLTKTQVIEIEHQIIPTPTITILKPQIKVSYKSQKAPPITPEPTKEWGIAKQIGEYTWTMNVGEDERMATPQEIFQALNDYRQRHTGHSLNWDDKLAQYAQDRANYFIYIGKTDAHAGFKDYLEIQDGFIKLGFAGLGENSSFGYKLLGVHLIEWVFAGDKPHNDNQLNPEWTEVGIGVNNTAVDIIFAKERL
ncbi:CAP domain-containing protein [Candidatus Parcubacteria bacterium]|nr:MAG: CAP domain-containing protein [Candidatus Parcubacteria bacterium]